MNLRMTWGGGERRHEHERYTEGYNAGYNNALAEMRHEEYYPTEDRRGRRRTRGMEEPYDGIRWMPAESRQIGFGVPHEEHHHDDRVDMLMDMMRELKQEHEQLKHGTASVTKKLSPHLVALLETASGVIDNPPSTWEAYVKRGDYLGIAKMEGKELLTALEAHKPVKDMYKELTHTLAALMLMATK